MTEGKGKTFEWKWSEVWQWKTIDCQCLINYAWRLKFFFVFLFWHCRANGTLNRAALEFFKGERVCKCVCIYPCRHVCVRERKREGRKKRGTERETNRQTQDRDRFSWCIFLFQLSDTDANLSRSRKILKTMGRRLVFVCLLSVCMFVKGYFKWGCTNDLLTGNGVRTELTAVFQSVTVVLC